MAAQAQPADGAGSGSVRVSVRVEVDPATAFDVFTREIGTWWGDGMRPGSGPDRANAGTLRFEPGAEGRLVEAFATGEVFEVGRVCIWEPGRRIVFEWRQGNFTPEQVTEVAVEFEAVAGGTQLTLTHVGLDRLPLDHGARHGLGDGDAFLRMFGDWWTERLGGLRAAVRSR